MSGQKLRLFEHCQPQNICEKQIKIKNNLILIQALSDHSWLLRKIINQLDVQEGDPSRYSVSLYHNSTLKKI